MSLCNQSWYLILDDILPSDWVNRNTINIITKVKELHSTSITHCKDFNYNQSGKPREDGQGILLN